MNSPDLPPPDPRPSPTEPPRTMCPGGRIRAGRARCAAASPGAGARGNRPRRSPSASSDWERRFAPWLADIAPVEAPAQVWTAGASRLGWRSRGRARAGPVAEPGVLARAPRCLRRAVAAIASRSGSVRAAAAAAARRPAAGAEPAAKPVTPLAHDDGTPRLAGLGGRRTRHRADGAGAHAADPQGRVPELWLIPAGKAPRLTGRWCPSRSRIPSRCRRTCGRPWWQAPCWRSRWSPPAGTRTAHPPAPSSPRARSST